MNRQRIKTNTISLKLSDKELERLEEQCNHTELSKSEYLRQSIYGRPVSTVALKELSYQLSKIGVNINQIARSCILAGHNTMLYSQMIKEISELRTKLKPVIGGYLE